MGPPIDILFEDGPCLVVAKPSGLLTQAPVGIDSLEARLKAFLKDREHKSGAVYLGVPHRLDRPVSGAIVFARHARAARRLAEQFEARTVGKLYWACVGGAVEPASGTWIDHLRKQPGEARVQIVSPDETGARRAALHFRVLGPVTGRREKSGAEASSAESTSMGTWLEIELETGRMHQIRVQAAARGVPVLGDAQYGSAVVFGEPHDDLRLRAIALHARRLRFEHPMTFQPVDVAAPLPRAWDALSLPVSAPTNDGIA